MTGQPARVLTILVALPAMLSAAVNPWINVGPEGGSVAGLAADPQNPSIVYAATCGGAIFKTGDGGASWSRLTSAPNLAALPSSIRCGPGVETAVLAADPVNSGAVYAVRCMDIFKTTDGGASWALTVSLKLRNCLETLTIGNQGTLFAGRQGSGGADGGEIIKSTDGGVTWTQVSTGTAPPIAVDPQDENTIYARTSGGLFKTTDGGATWNPANSGLPAPSLVAIDPRNTATLYAGIFDGRIFKSTDGGVSWSETRLGLPPQPAPNNGFGQLLSLAVSPQNPDRVYALVFRLTDTPTTVSYDFYLAMSSDGAASWTTAIDPLLAAADLATVVPDPEDPATVYLGTSNGVLKSTDGGARWNTVNSGLRATSIGQIAFDPQNGGTLFAVDYALAFRNSGLFKSTDAGQSWLPANAGLPVNIGGVRSLVTTPQDSLYVVGRHYPFGQSLFQSANGAASWAAIWNFPDTAAAIGPVAIDPRSASTLYAGVSICSGSCDSRVYKSTDGGRTWIKPQAALTTNGEIWALALDPQNPGVVYAGAADASGDGGNGLFKSTDSGSTWQNLTGGDDAFTLVIDPRNSQTIYYSNGFWQQSTDGGQTWVNMKVPCNAYLGSFAIDPQNSGTLFCGDDSKVFRSTDSGASWAELGSGLLGRVNSLAFDPSDPTMLYAGTDNGLFTLSLDARQP